MLSLHLRVLENPLGGGMWKVHKRTFKYQMPLFKPPPLSIVHLNHLIILTSSQTPTNIQQFPLMSIDTISASDCFPPYCFHLSNRIFVVSMLYSQYSASLTFQTFITYTSSRFNTRPLPFHYSWTTCIFRFLLYLILSSLHSAPSSMHTVPSLNNQITGWVMNASGHIGSASLS